MSTNQTKYTSKLAGQRVLICGGTSGIGYSVAEASIEHGATVIISGSNAERLAQTVQRLRADYPLATPEQISTHACDLLDTANMESNLDQLLAFAAGGYKINHIVFTAGDMFNGQTVDNFTVDGILSGGTVRFLAPLMIAKLIPKYMDVNAGSSFTVTGGTNTDKPGPGRTLFAAWGGGVEGYARGLAVDLAPLRVNVVSPGAIETEFWQKFGMDDERYQSFVSSMTKDTLTKEVGKPEDCAEAYLYAMKDRFLTGEIIRSNGGRVLVSNF